MVSLPKESDGHASDSGSSVESIVSSEDVSEPMAFGTTQLPKSELSYRWIIHDAKAFLEYSSEGVKSPAFSVTLPLETNHHVSTEWYLHVKKITITKQVSHQNYRGRYSTSNVVTVMLRVSLWQKESFGSDSFSFLSQCTFSIVNEMTERAFYTSDTRPIVQCGLVPGEVHKDESIKYKNVSKYLCGGRLTVQVNATLHFSGHNWPVQSGEEQISGAGLALRRGLKTLFDDNLFVDVTFNCADRVFRAHKGVLASQSAVFKQIFTTRKSSGLIEISDTDPEVISEMLQYLYTGSAPNI